MSNLLLPRRILQLSIQHVGQETLIYDEQTHRAFCLNPVAAAVWNRCDGETSSAAIAASASLALDLPVTEELVQLSLAELSRDGLLEPDAAFAIAPFTTLAIISRRDAMIKFGGRAAMMLPVVFAIAAPTAAQAYAGCANCNPPPTSSRSNRNTDIFSSKDATIPSDPLNSR
jgi:hypothetical protein